MAWLPIFIKKKNKKECFRYLHYNGINRGNQSIVVSKYIECVMAKLLPSKFIIIYNDLFFCFKMYKFRYLVHYFAIAHKSIELTDIAFY